MSQFTINVTEESLAAGATETMLQVVASASKGLDIVRWGVSFNGVSPTDPPVRVELRRLSSAGTSTAFVPLKIDPNSDAAIATARTAHTAEPSTADLLEVYSVTPYGGLFVMQYAFDERIKVAASGRLGIRCLSTAAVNCSAYLIFNE